MKQEQINYADIMALGFKEEIQEDSVYFQEYGYKYAIITKELTKRIYIDWTKDKRTCELIRIDKDFNIMSKMPIVSLRAVKDVIKFYTDAINVNDFTSAC